MPTQEYPKPRKKDQGNQDRQASINLVDGNLDYWTLFLY